MAVTVRVYLSDDEFIETEVDGATPIGEVLSWARDEGRIPNIEVALRRPSSKQSESKKSWNRPVVRLVA